MLERIKKFIDDKNCKTRFKVEYESESELTDWADYFTFPTDGYLEIPGFGPYKLNKVKWIEIDTIEEKRIGRLVSPKKINHIEVFQQYLNEEKISYCVEDSIIKIELNNTNID